MGISYSDAQLQSEVAAMARVRINIINMYKHLLAPLESRLMQELQRDMQLP